MRKKNTLPGIHCYPSAQAVYGSQATNGVILITTKKGKNGEGKISFKLVV